MPLPHQILFKLDFSPKHPVYSGARFSLVADISMMLHQNNVHKALKVIGPGQAELMSNIPIPKPRPDEVLIKVVKVALNPVDAKGSDLSAVPGATLGCDFAGTVVEIGAAVKKDLAVGDRVSGLTFGNNPDVPGNGAFAEYVVAFGDLLLKLPADMSFAAGCTLALGLGTVGLALYHTLQLPLPGTSSTSAYVLIHGGGTATGTLAIQLARE